MPLSTVFGISNQCILVMYNLTRQHILNIKSLRVQGLDCARQTISPTWQDEYSECQHSCKYLSFPIVFRLFFNSLSSAGCHCIPDGKTYKTSSQVYKNWLTRTHFCRAATFKWGVWDCGGYSLCEPKKSSSSSFETKIHSLCCKWQEREKSVTYITKLKKWPL